MAQLLKPLKKVYFFLKRYGVTVQLGFFSFNLFYRLLRPSLTDVLKKELPPGSVFVDVGANIGYYTIVASKLAGKKGKVFSFEPDKTNYKMLVKNIGSNNCINVKAFNMAVSDKRKMIKLYISTVDTSDHKTYKIEGRKSVKVKAVDLDSFVHYADFVKIDVEGYEPVVLKGMTKMIKNNPNIKIITEFGPDAIRSAGYDPIKYLEEYTSLGFKLYYVKERQEEAQEISTREAMKICTAGPKKVTINILCKSS